MNESSLLDFAWSAGVLQLTPMSINLVAHVLRHPKDNKKFLATNTGQSVGPWMFRYKTTRRSLSISSRKNTFRNYPQLNKWILSLPSLPPPIPSPPTSRTLRTLGVIASSLECVSLRAFFPVILFVGRCPISYSDSLLLISIFFAQNSLLDFTLHGINIPYHYDYYYFRRCRFG